MIGLIVAMDKETEAIGKLMSSKTASKTGDLVFYEGVLNGADIVMVKSGVGKVNAAAAATALILKYAPQAVISTGIAGGLNKLTPLTAVIVDGTVQHDMDTSALGDPKGLFSEVDKDICRLLLEAYPSAVCGRLASGDKFIADSIEAATVAEEFGAIACDMEGGAVAQVANKFNVPFGAIKVISDGANDGAGLTFTELSERASAINADVVFRTVNEL